MKYLTIPDSVAKQKKSYYAAIRGEKIALIFLPRYYYNTPTLEQLAAPFKGVMKYPMGTNTPCSVTLHEHSI